MMPEPAGAAMSDRRPSAFSVLTMLVELDCSGAQTPFCGLRCQGRMLLSKNRAAAAAAAAAVRVQQLSDDVRLQRVVTDVCL